MRGGGSNSPILRDVNDLIGVCTTNLLPPLDIRSSNDEDDKSKSNSDQEMKDALIGEVGESDQDNKEIQE